MKPTIEIRHISKLYPRLRQAPGTLKDDAGFKKKQIGPEGTFWALKDICFEVPRGQVVGIVGKNGSGKSTLLKILSKITEPTEGRVKLLGRSASLLEIGTGFHPDLSGRENIFLNGAILGMSRYEVQKKFDAIVEFSGVSDFIDTAIKHYSSGMYLRLAFSVAAHLETEIMMMDEVLAVGDLEFQQKCLKRILDIARQGKTILFVSHSLRHIQDVCSRGIQISNGQVAYDGTPDRLIENYVKSEGGMAVDISGGMEHFVHSESFRIERVTIKNSKGNETHQLYFREPFTAEFIIRVTQKLTRVRIGAGFSSLAETWVGRTHHPDGEKSIDLDPGKYAVSFSFCNTLRPGSYHLKAGAHLDLASELKTLDYIPHAILFTVDEKSYSPEILPALPFDHGLVALDAKTLIRRLA